MSKTEVLTIIFGLMVMMIFISLFADYLRAALGPI